jgi:hypothetical protein
VVQEGRNALKVELIQHSKLVYGLLSFWGHSVSGEDKSEPSSWVATTRTAESSEGLDGMLHMTSTSQTSRLGGMSMNVLDSPRGLSRYHLAAIRHHCLKLKMGSTIGLPPNSFNCNLRGNGDKLISHQTIDFLGTVLYSQTDPCKV